MRGVFRRARVAAVGTAVAFATLLARADHALAGPTQSDKLSFGLGVDTVWTGLDPTHDLGFALALEVSGELDHLLLGAGLLAGGARRGFLAAASARAGWLFSAGPIAPYAALGVARLSEFDLRLDAQDGSNAAAAGWAPFGEVGLYLGHGNPEGRGTVHLQFVTARYLKGGAEPLQPFGCALLGVRLLF